MSKHSITVRRDGMRGFLSSQRTGTDAINAILSIAGIKDPEILSESGGQVTLTFSWVGNGVFWATDEYLEKFCLTRV